MYTNLPFSIYSTVECILVKALNPIADDYFARGYIAGRNLQIIHDLGLACLRANPTATGFKVLGRGQTAYPLF